MTTREAVLAWAQRQADHEGVDCSELVIDPDGFVYAMSADPTIGALKWWPLPYLGPEGEAEFASGKLTEEPKKHGRRA